MPHAFYLSLVTMATVGYGDFAPKSSPGRGSQVRDIGVQRFNPYGSTLPDLARRFSWSAICYLGSPPISPHFKQLRFISRLASGVVL